MTLVFVHRKEQQKNYIMFDDAWHFAFHFDTGKAKILMESCLKKFSYKN